MFLRNASNCASSQRVTPFEAKWLIRPPFQTKWKLDSKLLRIASDAVVWDILRSLITCRTELPASNWSRTRPCIKWTSIGSSPCFRWQETFTVRSKTIHGSPLRFEGIRRDVDVVYILLWLVFLTVDEKCWMSCGIPRRKNSFVNGKRKTQVFVSLIMPSQLQKLFTSYKLSKFSLLIWKRSNLEPKRRVSKNRAKSLLSYDLATGFRVSETRLYLR